VSQILEREAELAALAAAAQEATRGAGSIVLVLGEAGIGKSSLVEAMGAHLPAEIRLLMGYCDDLATPRTLGPFRDLAGSVGAELGEALRDGSDRDSVLSALHAELDRPECPSVLVIEDVHWADDATLDALLYLARRVPRLPVVLVLTYRDDELGPEHPLRHLLGQVSRGNRLRRLQLHRLSEDAVRHLSAGSPVRAGEVFDLTAGNPFFVEEVIASAPARWVPSTVVDAVLARVGRLSMRSQDVVEQLSVVPSTLERWLVDALVPDAAETLAEAEQRGLLTTTPTRLAFRHELTRRAIVDSLPASRRVELNRRVLAVLVGRDGTDLSRLVHHAAEAGDRDVIVRYGPRAAREAARAGAHREAIAHYQLVLAHAEKFPPGEQAALSEECAIECYTIGASERAVAAERTAVDLRRALGESRPLGASLRWLSRMYWWAGDRDNAERTGQEAVDVLESSADSRLLALALSNLSQLHMLTRRSVEAVRLGERAATLARDAGDASTVSHALTNVGSAMWQRGDLRGQAALQEALQVALRASDVENACRAYVNTVWNLLDYVRLDEAEQCLAAAMDLAEKSEFLGFLSYMHVERSRLALLRSVWDEAVRHAELAVDAQPPMRCPALMVLGRVRTRRGQAGAAELLGQAWQLAVEMDELQRTGPVAGALAEAAWLRGDLAEVRTVAMSVYEDARRHDDRPLMAELGYWLSKAGCAAESFVTDHPYALQAAGQWREAAAAWRAAGCPYEHAAALADSQRPEDLLVALRELDDIGADPLARRVRARLRMLGVTRIPRGPTDATRANPAGLTARQVEVLRLLADGLTSPQIAERLVLSVRTVESHVAAVLDKLGAPNRRAAVARATDLGILAKP
jgi:DNA-binding CsgD family transcriptional regulator/tetratricopeptide (TPR) repeat protein